VKATNCAIENAPLEAEMTEFCVCWQFKTIVFTLIPPRSNIYIIWKTLLVNKTLVLIKKLFQKHHICVKTRHKLELRPSVWNRSPCLFSCVQSYHQTATWFLTNIGSQLVTITIYNMKDADICDVHVENWRVGNGQNTFHFLYFNRPIFFRFIYSVMLNISLISYDKR
jgi:hypothetical protein